MFFHNNKDTLEKSKIGEFIGGHEDLNINVLSEFTDLIDFKGLTLVDGMRHFLDQFTLPGEA